MRQIVVWGVALPGDGHLILLKCLPDISIVAAIKLASSLYIVHVGSICYDEDVFNSAYLTYSDI